MNQLITVTVEEAQENFDFLFTLVERGHTIKIVTEKGACLMTPIANIPEINIPTPESFTPDPVGVRNYVNESLGEMSQEFQ